MLRAILMPVAAVAVHENRHQRTERIAVDFYHVPDHGFEGALHQFFQERNLDRINVVDGVERSLPQIVSLLPELRKANDFHFATCHRIVLLEHKIKLTGERTPQVSSTEVGLECPSMQPPELEQAITKAVSVTSQ